MRGANGGSAREEGMNARERRSWIGGGCREGKRPMVHLVIKN